MLGENGLSRIVILGRRAELGCEKTKAQQDESNRDKRHAKQVGTEHQSLKRLPVTLRAAFAASNP